MKIVVAISLLFCTTALPALAELTPEDIDQIRSTVKEAFVPLQEDVASLRGKMGTLEKKIYWLMGLIVVAVGIPQIVIAWHSKKDREQDQKIEELTREVQTLKEQRIVKT